MTTKDSVMDSGNFPDLNTNADTSLKDLDFDQLRQERFERNRTFLEGVDAAVAHMVLPHTKEEEKSRHPQDFAALTIQRFWRGFKGRQVYVSKLFEQYEQEEAKRAEHTRYQMEEGDLLVENHQLEVLLDDGETTRRNTRRRYISKVITIQRAWRSYLDRTHNNSLVSGNQGDIRTSPCNRNQASKGGSQKSFICKGNHCENDYDDKYNDDVEQSECMLNPLAEIENESLESSQNQVEIGKQSLRKLPDFSNLSPTQQRKKFLLTQAHQFAQLKKQDSSILPFNLHIHLNKGRELDSEPQQRGATMSDKMSPLQSVGNSEPLNNNVTKPSPPQLNSSQREDSLSQGINSGCETVCDIKGDNSDTKGEKCSNCGLLYSKGGNQSANCVNGQCKAKGSKSGEENESSFDVYNIETALPDMDWKSLEEKLKAASEEAKRIQEARRNDREEIRKKLAFGADDDSYDDNDDEESVDDASYKKGTLQSRLHSGLQICFMNESPCDTDNEGISPRPHELHDNTKHMMQKDDVLVDSDNNLSTVEDLNHPCTSSTVDHSSGPPRLKPVLQPETSDFQTRQEQLQNEAKVALAQAGSMAHMQLEIERQTKKKSPIAEMAGIPGLGERRRKKLSPRQLQQMNLAQTQVLYNDLQTQIESLNEELVHLLMERDELHMEQDSMLVDIEDLTRRAEELAEKANRDGKTKTCCIQGQLPR